MPIGVSMARPSEKASLSPKRVSTIMTGTGTRTSRQVAGKESPSTTTEGGTIISQKGPETNTDPYAIGREDTPTLAVAASLRDKAARPLEGDSMGGGGLPLVKTVPKKTKKTSTKTNAPDNEEKEAFM